MNASRYRARFVAFIALAACLVVSQAAFADTAKTPDGRWGFTSLKQVTDADLAGLSKAELRLMRNEIFARHGRAFKSADLTTYFSQQPWYRVDSEFQDGDLSAIEKANVALIAAAEAKAPLKKDTSAVSVTSPYWTSFKAAVASNDKEAVARMTSFPFRDHNGEVYNPDTALSAQNKEEFLRNYDRLFDAERKEAVARDTPEQYVFFDETGDNAKVMAGQFTFAGFIFSVVKGELKLREIPYEA